VLAVVGGFYRQKSLSPFVARKMMQGFRMRERHLNVQSI